MLRVASNTELEGFTEFEEDILFDEDDPDFDHDRLKNMPILFREHKNLLRTTITLSTPPVPSKMSLASVHPAGLRSSHGSLTPLSHSLDDISVGGWSPQVNPSDYVMTIEELRLQMTSCFTCGVSWADDHVSLDCSECGGYALQRPCSDCDGNCGAVWKRDLNMSHESGRARWTGECNRSYNNQQSQKKDATTTALVQELSTRLEKISANS